MLLPTLCAIMATLIPGSSLKKGSSWPLGHVVLLPGQDAPQLCYIGDEAPKLLLLVNAARPQTPEICVELRDGQGVLNIGGYHCQQEGCLTCFLANCVQLPLCPWHSPQDADKDRLPLSVSHFICTKDPSTSIVELVGQSAEGPVDGVIQVFHVCTSEQCSDLRLYSQVAPCKVSFCKNALYRDDVRTYCAFDTPHLGLDTKNFVADVLVENILYLGDTRSADDLSVFTKMAPERLCLGCGLRVDEPFAPISTGERKKLFYAAQKLLTFVLHEVSAQTLSAEETALKIALRPLTRMDTSWLRLPRCINHCLRARRTAPSAVSLVLAKPSRPLP